MAESLPGPSQIAQTTQGDRNQTIGQIYGGIVVYGNVTLTTPVEPPSEPKPSQSLGANPYKGLLAFDESDGDRYFGRSQEIQTLWERFRALSQSVGAIRLLPIYGPSGSGKSSLAKAGLLPVLGRNLLPGKDSARVAVLVPGTKPLESLATVLARIAENDPTPVKKTREFAEELSVANKEGDFDGLQRIVSVLPDISKSPLVVLVDQFEEVYSLCKDEAEREQFIRNLLYAAADRTCYVLVIITCRSDFLGSTQQIPAFNKLFSTQGFLVPIMQPEDLAAAIAEPAKHAGYKFNPATVKFLVEQTRGHQGALPLLQFALQRIWSGIEQGYEPLDTLEQIGGVGGALADEAKQLYDSLSEDEKKIAPRIFLALVQIDNGNEVTRRRARKAELITDKSDIPQVDAIIKRLAAPSVRFLVTSFTEEDGEIIEVAHEALIQNWAQLQNWIVECREALRQKRKIEQAAQEWERKEKAKGYLLQGRPMRDAREFMQSHKSSQNTGLSRLATEFINISLKVRNRELFKTAVVVFVLPVVILTPLLFYSSVLLLGSWSLRREDCTENVFNHFFLDYRVKFIGQKGELSNLQVCGDNLSNIDLSFERGVYSILNSDFSDTNLSDAKFRDTTLYQVEMTGSELYDADLTKSTFIDSDLQNSKLVGAILRETVFIDVNLKKADFSHAILDKVFFIKSDLSSSIINSNQAARMIICESSLPSSLNIEPNRDCKNPKVVKILESIQ